MKRWLGLDVVDTAIHVFVTFCAAFLFAELPSPFDEDAAIAVVFASSAVLFGIRRHLALRRAQDTVPIGEMAAERLADLEARVAELEEVQDRLLQLEERMDFSERLLVQHKAPDPNRVSARDS